MVVLFHPSEQIAALAGVPVLLMVAYWFLRRRHAVLAVGKEVPLQRPAA